MPKKKLIVGELVTEHGECCTLGVVCRARGINVDGIDPTDSDVVAEAIGLSEAMVKEIAYLNDEGTWQKETPEQLWGRMRKWVAEHISVTPAR